MKLSVVSTMYRSSPFLQEFCQRVEESAKQLVGEDYELVLVNDGSPDDSLDVALRLQQRNRRIQVVDLSRNFGHHAAIVAGLEHSAGDLVLLMDCDLEEQPEWLGEFATQMAESGADVVFGVQQERTASPVSNLLGDLFWSSLNFMSTVRIPHSPMTCRLMARRYVNALLSVQDRVLYLAGTFAWTGFKQQAIPLKKTPRPTNHPSSYKLSRKLMQVADSFSSFSVAPLTFVFLLGLSIWLGSIAFALYIFLEKLLFPDRVLSGFTSMMMSIWFLGGTIILVLGVLGLYLAKVFQESKRRPLYVVKELYRGGDEQFTE